MVSVSVSRALDGGRGIHRVNPEEAARFIRRHYDGRSRWLVSWHNPHVKVDKEVALPCSDTFPDALHGAIVLLPKEHENVLFEVKDTTDLGDRFPEILESARRIVGEYKPERT